MYLIHLQVPGLICTGLILFREPDMEYIIISDTMTLRHALVKTRAIIDCMAISEILDTAGYNDNNLMDLKSQEFTPMNRKERRQGIGVEGENKWKPQTKKKQSH